jgi:aspartate racemase
MIPSAFVVLDAIPMTIDGKVDRSALPDPGNLRPDLGKPYVAPRTPTEEKLVNIWADVLGIDRVGIQDDFFDLGGHSLLVARLFAQIEKTFGKQFPVATLYWARTVERLAGILQQAGWSPPLSLLFPIQPGGSNPPFFWVYGESSDVLLPRYLGPDQPLYGLMHEGRTGKRTLHTQLGDIAAHHLKEIRAVQSEGPYFLGGFCFGGMVAFEMAQQLRKQGQEVALLFLLDLATIKNCKFLLDQGPNRYEPLSKITAIRDKALHHSRNLVTLRPQEQLTYVRVRMEDGVREVKDRIREVISRGKNIADKVVRNFYFMTGSPLPISLQARYVSEVDRRAVGNYEPQTYPGRLVHFKAEGSTYDPQLIEKLTAGGLEAHEVPCSHADLINESHIHLWAEKLRSCLTEAQALSQHKRTFISNTRTGITPIRQSDDNQLANSRVEAYDLNNLP